MYIQYNTTHPLKVANSSTCEDVDRPRDCYMDSSKSEREREIPYDIIYMWNLKYDTNDPIYGAETESGT